MPCSPVGNVTSMRSRVADGSAPRILASGASSCPRHGSKTLTTRAAELHRHLGTLAVRGELAPACGCRAGTRPGLVLDPFMGAGTVAVAARTYGRDWLGVELNPRFVALTTQRLNNERRAA